MSGYSGTPLVRKLGMKPGMRIYLYLPPPDYDAMIETYPADVTFASRLTGTLDFIHLFCMSMREYQMNFDRCMTHLAPEGMIWVSWPKKTSGVQTDLDEAKIREYGLAAGMVDIKVCAVDDTWSALKFVIPLNRRAR